MSYCEFSAGVLLACAKVAEQDGSLPIVKDLLSGTFSSLAELADYPENDVMAIRNNVTGYSEAPIGVDADYETIYCSLVDGRLFALSPCGRFRVDISGLSAAKTNELLAGWNQQLMAGQ
ncbi:hypothetical protein ABLV18_27680 [Klebsiella sp. CN_Kp114]|uniref:hypothetical protein n=1 Tax=unclassified Klebsiella TaxID=2608929 RepID=UPI0032B4429E